MIMIVCFYIFALICNDGNAGEWLKAPLCFEEKSERW